MSVITAKNRITLEPITSGNMKLTSCAWLQFFHNVADIKDVTSTCFFSVSLEASGVIPKAPSCSMV